MYLILLLRSVPQRFHCSTWGGPRGGSTSSALQSMYTVGVLKPCQHTRGVLVIFFKNGRYTAIIHNTTEAHKVLQKIHDIQQFTFEDFYSLSAIDTLQPFFVLLNFDRVTHALIDIYICTVYVYNCHHHRKGMLILQIKSISVTVKFH